MIIRNHPPELGGYRSFFVLSVRRPSVNEKREQKVIFDLKRAWQADLFTSHFHTFPTSFSYRIIWRPASASYDLTWLDSHTFLEMRAFSPS